MGVPIVDSDNVIPKLSESSEKKNEQKQSKTQQTTTNQSEPKPRKDLIGNCKEFRIDCNRNNLRIIGNGNKIRINQNSGNLDIVGNGTRVKITNNSGAIKYTGNSGRIYLGSESSEQSVDYIGCNGILKVVKPTELRTDRPFDRQEKCQSSSSYSSSSDTESGRKHKGHSHGSSSSSYCGLNIKNNVSLPDLVGSSCRKSANITNCINLSSSTGNIIIKNAINVAI